MKKVLFFIESLAGGGAEKILSDIVEQLPNDKFDITVMTVSDNGVYVNKVKKACSFKSFLMRSDYAAGGMRKLKYWICNKLIYTLPESIVYSLCIKERYDVEVAFIEGFATKLISASKHKSKKYAWLHIDMLKNPYADNFYRNLEDHKSAYQKFDKVIAVSETVKQSYQDKFGLNNCDVIYNPIPVNEILNKGNEPIDVERNSNLQFVTIGRLENQKGYQRLLHCLQKIDNTADYSLWIIGDGSLKNQLLSYIDMHKMADRVKLLGYQANPYKFLAKSDAFICSSYAEGFSTAATESLLLGVPVFTVNCAGMKELISKNQSGKIVPNTDEDLLQMIKDLILKKDDLTKYKANAEKSALELKNSDQMGKIEELLYE